MLTALLLNGLHGQELKTEKVRFNMKDLEAETGKNDEATGKPVIEIIAPVDRGEGFYRSEEKSIDLIGQVSAVEPVTIVMVNSKIAEVGENGMFSYSLDLDPGGNLVKLIAVDALKNMTEKVITVSYTPPVVTLADMISDKSTYYGLIIGIDEYADESIPDLDNPVRDAQKVHDALIANYTFEEDDIIMLKDATRGDLIQALDDLAQKVTPEDNLLIFYAGHGWWDEVANNGYWLPADADSHVKTNWFRNSALVDYLKEINSRHTLLITDACFGGSIFKTRSAFPAREKAYEKLYDLPSRKAMTSGTLTEVPDRSSFTRFLVERLNENQETYISSEQLFSSFRIAVINNSDAVPQFGEIGNVGDQGGDFIFIRKE